MTENAATRAQQSDRYGIDLYPSCPRCGNLCGRLAVVCADCGARLKPTENDLRLARMNAARPREDTEATPGDGA